MECQDEEELSIEDVGIINAQLEELFQENHEFKNSKATLELMCNEIDEEENLNETRSNENIPTHKEKYDEPLMNELNSLEDALCNKLTITEDNELQYLKNDLTIFAASFEKNEKDKVELGHAITNALEKKEDFLKALEILRDSLQHVTGNETNDLTDLELEEVNEALRIAKELLVTENEAIREYKNEITVKSAEVTKITSQPNDINKRGNSLFGKIDDMAKSIKKKNENLEILFEDLRNNVTVKMREIEHLKEFKMEYLNLKAKQERNEVEVSPFHELIKKHINIVEEMEAETCQLSKKPDSPQIQTCGPHTYNMRYIHKLVDDARLDARKAMEEFNNLSSEKLSGDFRKKESANEKDKHGVKIYTLDEEIKNLEEQLETLKEFRRDSHKLVKMSSCSGSKCHSRFCTEEIPPDNKKIVQFAEDVKKDDGGVSLKKLPKQKEYKKIKVITRGKTREDSN